MQRADITIFVQNQGETNLSIWVNGKTQTQYILDRSSQKCQKNPSGQWSNSSIPADARFDSRRMQGVQLVDMWSFEMPQFGERFLLWTAGGAACIPVKLDIINSTSSSLIMTESIYNFVESIDRDLFDLPAACQQSSLKLSRTSSMPKHHFRFL
jgi:hypothetical protein